MVNFTDFIDISRLIRFYNGDQIMQCYDTLTKEKVVVGELFNFQASKGIPEQP